MYNTLPYYSVYDSIIDQRVHAIFADHMIITNKPKYVKFPTVNEIVMKKGKPHSISRAVVTTNDILLSHAQSLSRNSTTTIEVILHDLTVRYNHAINTCSRLLAE